MFSLKSTSSARALVNARVSIFVGVAAIAVALFSATAASAVPTLEASVDPAEAMAAPEITTGIVSDDPVVITGSTIKMPVGWKARNPRAVRACTQANFQARNCAENTRIGTVSSRAVIGALETDATGGVHLLESHADNDPVKIGFIVNADLNGRPFPIPVFGANITLEPDRAAAADRIVVTFTNTPAIPVTSFSITLDGGEKGLVGTGPYDHFLGNQQCGVKTFDGVVTVRGQDEEAISDTININRNCDPFAVIDRLADGQQSPMRPTLTVRSLMQAHSDVSFEVAGAINDGDRGYHSVKAASMYLPVSSSVDLNAVQQCGANAGANCPAASKVGETTMQVAAAGQSHNVRGNVYLTNGGLRMVYTNTPVRLNNRAPIVLNASLQRVRMGGNRYRIMVGNHANANAAGFPTVYEVKNWSFTLDGDAGGDFLTHDREQCLRDEADRAEHARIFGTRRGAFTSSFSSDYGLPYWPLSVRCSALGGRQKSLQQSAEQAGGKFGGDAPSAKATKATSKAGKTKTVAFVK